MPQRSLSNTLALSAINCCLKLGQIEDIKGWNTNDWANKIAEFVEIELESIYSNNIISIDEKEEVNKLLSYMVFSFFIIGIHNIKTMFDIISPEFSGEVARHILGTHEFAILKEQSKSKVSNKVLN